MVVYMSELEKISTFAKHWRQSDTQIQDFSYSEEVFSRGHNNLLGRNHNNFIKIQKFKTVRPVSTCALGNASEI